MIKADEFREWLTKKGFQGKVVNDIVCRAKRADGIKEYDGAETYLFYLNEEAQFKNLTITVRSQLRRAIRLYIESQL